MQDLDLVQSAAKALYDRKALDILALRTGHLTVLCDFMLIASGRNANQVTALIDEVDRIMAEAGIPLRRSEGQREGRWAILDYGFLMVHVFHRDDRAYYNLERLWTDGTNELELPFDQTVRD